ncbi:unnamed protein product [Miscanthus lutarioriparius]|uniref:RING-type E3 ubiquitin transferase n=1 Tax=Miscanthus lutarioriparius TaxID=422564 RepID=A0A811S938_9POAL|nr:unnamed protein product [Miscanthus lutarioriparius]
MLLLLGLATGLAVAGEVEKRQDGGGAASSGGGGHGSKISPVVLFVVVIAAVVLFVSCLLHLVVRLLLRRGRARARAEAGADGGVDAAGGGGEESALQRQLQQLFHLHDAGLDQDVIDALPVFLYREVVVGASAGAKEPFDCAVCLCEFAGEDRLRLLPLCGHAFHIDCIDTWLLSNSTCPLCRCALGADADALFVDGFDEEGGGWKHEDAVLPVRLGKFKNLSRAAPGPIRDGAGIVTREDGETSSSSLDARRCYSMGSYQYVLAEASLQVSVHRRHGDGHARAGARLRGVGSNPAGTETDGGAGTEGKRIGAGSKGDSFSVSKIWQWPRNGKGKLPVLASDDSPAMNMNGGRLPWQRPSPGDS